MQLEISGNLVDFRTRASGHDLVAPFLLPRWAGYRCENSRPDFLGEKVLFILQSPIPIAPSDSDHYSRLIAWFLANEAEIQTAAIASLTDYVLDLKSRPYRQRDSELQNFDGPSQLKGMVDLSSIRFHDELASSEPSFGLEFECNWDPEHGCGLLFEGTHVDDIGGSEVSLGI